MVWVKFQCLSLFSMPVLFGTRASSAWTFVSHFLQWMVHSVSPQMSIVNCCFWTFCVCGQKGALWGWWLCLQQGRGTQIIGHWQVEYIHELSALWWGRRAPPWYWSQGGISLTLGLAPVHWVYHQCCWKIGHSKTQWSRVHINFILHSCCSWVPWHLDQYACFVNCEHCKEILLHVHAAFVKKWWTFCQSCRHALFFMLVWIFSYIETLAPISCLSDLEELLALTTDCQF